MRIAIYAGMFRRDQDGATKTIYRLVDSMLEAGIEVGVWAFSFTPQERKGLHLFRLPSFPWPLYRDYHVSLATPSVLRSIGKFAPDLIHVTVPDFGGGAFVRYAKRNHIPIVATYHTVFPDYLRYFKIGFLTWLAWRQAARFYQKLDVVYMPTEIAAQELRRRGVRHIKIWSRGIDLEQFRPTFREPQFRESLAGGREAVILYAGRLVGFKDVDTLAETYALYHKGPERRVRFVIAGSGPEEKALKKRMPEASFRGYLHGHELSRIYANSDLLLFPSQTESFGNVVLEALASGIPAVVSDRGGCQEIIKLSGAGLVARSGDAADFHRQSSRVIGDREMYRQMREHGLEFVQNRSWDKITLPMVKELASLAGVPPQDYSSGLRQKSFDARG